jgi:hypothetical protein
MQAREEFLGIGGQAERTDQALALLLPFGRRDQKVFPIAKFPTVVDPEPSTPQPLAHRQHRGGLQRCKCLRAVSIIEQIMPDRTRHVGVEAHWQFPGALLDQFAQCDNLLHGPLISIALEVQVRERVEQRRDPRRIVGERLPNESGVAVGL